LRFLAGYLDDAVDEEEEEEQAPAEYMENADPTEKKNVLVSIF
jgi:hypothetical protein